MRAVVTEGTGGMELCDVPAPLWGDYDCLVRMEVCAFCNSTDRHIVEGTFPFDLAYPAILGHESVGVVEQTGARVTHFAPGDRVLRPYALYPDEVAEGLASAWGGLAEWGKVCDWRAMAEDVLCDPQAPPHAYAYQQRVPPGITAEQAAIMIPMKEVHSAVESMGDVRGRRLVVSGAGVVAYLFGVFLRMRGARHVAMVARRPEPLEFALRNGAADSVCVLSEVERLPADLDAMVEATGSLAVAEALAEHVSLGGDIFAYAVYPGMDDDAIYEPLRRNHAFRRLDPLEATAHEAVCRLIQDGAVQAESLITHQFALSYVDQAWRTVTDRRALKMLVRLQD